MNFSTVVAAVLSMAVVTFAAPIAVADAAGKSKPRSRLWGSYSNKIVAQNHGMCVSGDAGTITQIENC